MAQLVKLLLAEPVSHMNTGLSPGCSTSYPLLPNVPREAMEDGPLRRLMELQVLILAIKGMSQ